MIPDDFSDTFRHPTMGSVFTPLVIVPGDFPDTFRHSTLVSFSTPFVTVTGDFSDTSPNGRKNKITVPRPEQLVKLLHSTT